MYYKGEDILEMMSRAEGFKEIPLDYHIVGIRSAADAPNKFDDVFNLFKGKELILTATGTTNPGTPVLVGGFLKYNKDGAAVVAANHVYYNVWKYGKHQNVTPALVQIGAPITVFRDGDKDNKSEEIGKKSSGYFGINFHPDQRDFTGVDKASELINGWSAGCQVCDNIAVYRKIIELVKNQKAVTYTLLNEFSV